MNKKKMQNITSFIVITSLLLVILLALLGYTKAVHANIDEYAHSNLTRLVQLQKNSIQTHFDFDQQLLGSVGESFEDNHTSYGDAVLSLAHLKEASGFQNLQVLDSSQSEIYFDRPFSSTNKGPFFYVPTQETMDPDFNLHLICPVYFHGVDSLQYTLVASYTLGDLKAMVENSFDEHGNIGVINGSGQLIFSTKITQEYQDLRFTYLNQLLSSVTITEESSPIAETLKNHQPGSFTYTYGKETVFCQYTPLELNDWSVIVHTNRSMLSSNINFGGRDAIRFFLVVCSCLFWLALYITYLKNQTKKTLTSIAFYDELTGLPNGKKFRLEVEKILANHPNKVFSCVVFDICDFKLINNRFGNATGDRLLCTIAQTAQPVFEREEKGTAYFAKLHSDTYAYILFANSQTQANLRILSSIKELRENAAFLGQYKLNFYFGRYVSHVGDSAELIIENALTAHSYAKKSKPNVFVNYDDAFIASLRDKVDILNAFDSALENHEFQLYLQPQYDSRSKTLSGAEALVRWIKDGKIKHYPQSFIPILEDSGKITLLDTYLRTQLCILLKQWITEGIDLVPVSVNVSRIELGDEDFVPKLKQLLETYEIPTHLFHLEITETAYVGDHEYLIDTVSQLQSLGFCVEMDDFGSGYSSLNVLKDIPVDVVKLDLRFIETSSNPARSGSILSSVIRLAQGIDLVTIAEGVESKEQADYLRSIGCTFMQGYYFAKPMPVEDFYLLLKGNPISQRWRKPLEKEFDASSNFLDATTQETLLFNTYLGGAAIVEYANQELRVLRVNDKYYDVLSTTKEEFNPFSINILDCLIPFSKKQLLDKINYALATLEEVSGETCMYSIANENAYTWQLYTLKCLSKEQQRAIFYVGLVDITERKDMEEKIRQNDEELKIRLGHVDKHLLRYDVKTKVLTSSSEYAKLHSIPEALDNVPDSFEEFSIRYLGKSCDPNIFQFYNQILDGEESGFAELYHFRGKKKYWERSEFVSIFDDEGLPIRALITNTDITNQKQKEENLIRTFQLLGKRVLSFDIKEKILYDLEHNLVFKNIPYSIWDYSFIVDDFHKEKYIQFFESMILGNPTGCTELPFLKEDHSTTWERMEFSTVFDENNQPVRAIISLVDVTDSHLHLVNIEKQAQTDGLTNIYNRITAENLVREKIANHKNFTFAMVDLDDLKTINDTFGHALGDQAIKKIASILKDHFRSTDIVGRFGGDEFIVFLLGLQDEATASELFTRLLNKIRAVELDSSWNVSCSIGAVLCDNAANFDTLYSLADAALYEAKRSGKNKFSYLVHSADNVKTNTP